MSSSPATMSLPRSISPTALPCSARPGGPPRRPPATPRQMSQRRCPHRRVQGHVPTGRSDQLASTSVDGRSAVLGQAMAHRDALHPRGAWILVRQGQDVETSAAVAHRGILHHRGNRLLASQCQDLIGSAAARAQWRFRVSGRGALDQRHDLHCGRGKRCVRICA